MLGFVLPLRDLDGRLEFADQRCRIINLDDSSKRSISNDPRRLSSVGEQMLRTNLQPSAGKRSHATSESSLVRIDVMRVNLWTFPFPFEEPVRDSSPPRRAILQTSQYGEARDRPTPARGG